MLRTCQQDLASAGSATQCPSRYFVIEAYFNHKDRPSKKPPHSFHYFHYKTTLSLNMHSKQATLNQFYSPSTPASASAAPLQANAQPTRAASKRKRRRRNKPKKITAADIVYSSTDLVHFGLMPSLQPSSLSSLPPPSIALTEYTSALLAKAVTNNESSPMLNADLLDLQQQEQELGEEEEAMEEEGDDSAGELALGGLEEVKEDGEGNPLLAEESAELISFSSTSSIAAEVGSYSFEDIASLAILAFDSVSLHCTDSEMPPHTSLQSLQTFVSGEHGHAAQGSKQAKRGHAPSRGKKAATSSCTLQQLGLMSVLRQDHSLSISSIASLMGLSYNMVWRVMHPNQEQRPPIMAAIGKSAVRILAERE
jgi:hypothetical protein